MSTQFTINGIPMLDIDTLNTFQRAYFECALWSSTNDEGEPLDNDYDITDLSPETWDQMKKDCIDFVETNKELLEGLIPSQSGHDFWLNRNGHGAGFWDRGLGEVGNKLSEMCKLEGSIDLYVGDDKKIYI